MGRKGNASTAACKETASENEADMIPEEGNSEEPDKKIPEDWDAAGNYGAISVLFETPSGFAIFGYDASKLDEPGGWKHIWSDFVNEPQAIVWRRAFRRFEDKCFAINNNTVSVSPELRLMINKYVVNGQRLAVGNDNYKYVIHKCLGLDCFYNSAVEELMWGLNIQISRFVPEEISYVERFPVSKGMEIFLNDHKIKVNENMMIHKRFIEMAGIMYECDRRVDEHDTSLRLAGKHLMDISQIDTKDWDLLKLATALRTIVAPERSRSTAAKQLFSDQQWNMLTQDAPLYKGLIFAVPCLELYHEIYSARKTRLEAAKVLVRLIKRAKRAYGDELPAKEEDKQAHKAASDHEIGPDRKKICRGFHPDVITELTEWCTTLSAKRKERQVPPTLAPAEALQRYTHVSGYPPSVTNVGGTSPAKILEASNIITV